MRPEPYLVAFAPEHLKRFDPGIYDLAAMTGYDLQAQAERWAGKAVSVAFEDRILAIVGISLDQDGGAHGWMLASDEMRRRPYTLHRGMVRWLRKVPDLFGLDTLDITVDPFFTRAQRWAERLGFREIERKHNHVRFRITWHSSRPPQQPQQAQQPQPAARRQLLYLKS